MMEQTNNKVISVQDVEDAAEAICSHYCKYPYEWDEEKEGVTLADSDICKECPMMKLLGE